MIDRQTFVILGAGQAGQTVAETLRDSGFVGRIVMLGEDEHRPYQRPPLSKKFLMNEVTADRLYFRSQEFYAQNAIELHTASQVSSIDPSRRQVWTADGDEWGYDKLVLATGSAPRRLTRDLGGELEGVHYLRSIGDAESLGRELRGGRELLIIGGGYIGLEVASVAIKLGLVVTVAEAAPQILQRVAAPETASFFRMLHSANGVSIQEGCALERLIGDDNGRVCAARFANGSVKDIDLVLIGIGGAPCTAIAQAAGLAEDRGILVNGHGLTSDSDIYAVGDCSRFPFRDRMVRFESVQNAVDQAKIVGGSLLGRDVAYVPLPWFWSDQFSTKLQIAGYNEGFTRTVRRVNPNPNSQSIWYFNADKLVAVDAINDPRSFMIGKRWIEQGRSPTQDHIVDSSRKLDLFMA